MHRALRQKNWVKAANNWGSSHGYLSWETVALYNSYYWHLHSKGLGQGKNGSRVKIERMEGGWINVLSVARTMGLSRVNESPSFCQANVTAFYLHQSVSLSLCPSVNISITQIQSTRRQPWQDQNISLRSKQGHLENKTFHCNQTWSHQKWPK